MSLFLLLIPSASWGQGIAYCNVTKVETKRLVNAVQVTIQADGLMRVRWREEDFFNVEAIQTGQWDKLLKQVPVLPLKLVNARSKVGSFVDVGIYPISHVEISIPPDAPEGVVLDLRVVLFAPGTTWSIQTPWGWNIGMDNIKAPAISIRLTQDQRSLIIIATSDRRTIPPVERHRPPTDARTELLVSFEKESLSVYALNADLRQVVGEIARKSGKAIQADDTVDHIVSLSLRDVTVEEALQALATTYGLSLEREGPVIRLSEGVVRDLPTYGESALETIRLKYLSAISARDSLPEFLLRYLHVNREENALTVFGPRLLVEKVREDLQKIDRPVPQIEIEAMAVEFSSIEDLEAALNLTSQVPARDSQGNPTYDVNGYPIYTVTGSLDSATGNITYNSVGKLSEEFQARLHALESSGRVRIRAKPRAVALNGQTARLFVGRQKYIKVNYYDYWYEAYLSRILAVDVGAKLEITPWAGGNGEITAEVAPEVSNIVELERLTGLPVVSTRNARTTVRVKDGETIVIGGLSIDQNEARRQKIPLLGDLPLIGWLFQAPKRTRTRTELALFVTPHIVTGKSVPKPQESASPDRKALPLSAWSHTIQPPSPAPKA